MIGSLLEIQDDWSVSLGLNFLFGCKSESLLEGSRSAFHDCFKVKANKFSASAGRFARLVCDFNFYSKTTFYLYRNIFESLRLVAYGHDRIKIEISSRSEQHIPATNGRVQTSIKSRQMLRRPSMSENYATIDFPRVEVCISKPDVKMLWDEHPVGLLRVGRTNSLSGRPDRKM